MGVRDHQNHSSKPSLHQIPKKRGPERLRLRRPARKTQHFPSSLGVGPYGYDDRRALYLPVLPTLQVGRIQPQVYPLALQGPAQELLHLAVQIRAQPRDLAPGDPTHPQCLH